MLFLLGNPNPRVGERNNLPLAFAVQQGQHGYSAAILTYLATSS
jgi:hypothetical protein